MADETTTPAADATTPQAPEHDAAVATPHGDAPGKTADETAGKTFTQAEVDALIAQRLERARKSAEESANKARSEAERKAAEQQGEFQKLYEAEKAQREATEQRAKALELASLRRDVAEKMGVPSALAARLQGETLEELEADAKALMAALPKPGAPNTNATGGGKPPTNGYSEQERVNLAARLGVSSKYFGKTGE
jgi:hypothetical protein